MARVAKTSFDVCAFQRGGGEASKKETTVSEGRREREREIERRPPPFERRRRPSTTSARHNCHERVPRHLEQPFPLVVHAHHLQLHRRAWRRRTLQLTTSTLYTSLCWHLRKTPGSRVKDTKTKETDRVRYSPNETLCCASKLRYRSMYTHLSLLERERARRRNKALRSKGDFWRYFFLSYISLPPFDTFILLWGAQRGGRMEEITLQIIPTVDNITNNILYITLQNWWNFKIRNEYNYK